MTNTPRFKATLRCHHTGGEFDVWVSEREEAATAAEKLEASVVAVEPSSQTSLDIALLMTALGLRSQLRMPE